jgi:hypothetical protein
MIGCQAEDIAFRRAMAGGACGAGCGATVRPRCHVADTEPENKTSNLSGLSQAGPGTDVSGRVGRLLP